MLWEGGNLWGGGGSDEWPTLGGMGMVQIRDANVLEEIYKCQKLEKGKREMIF